MAAPLPPEKMISHERLVELLDYDPDTGRFTWKKNRQRIRQGTIAGAVHPDDYIYIRIDQSGYRAHRLAWFYVYGAWPTGYLDHINRIRGDNRISNLRDVTSQENVINQGVKRTNKSGYKGVWHDKKNGRWVAHIKVKGRAFRLGTYKEKAFAIAARRAAVVRHFGADALAGEGRGVVRDWLVVARANKGALDEFRNLLQIA